MPFSNHSGQLTFEKSRNSVEASSVSPTSPADSPYSSQSLESDTGLPPATASDRIGRSMPNLNHPSRLRMPQPSAGNSNLNRQHTSSDSGLRPPSAGVSGIRPPVGRPVNGTLLRPPQVQPVPTVAIPNALKPMQQPVMRLPSIPPSAGSNLVPYSSFFFQQPQRSAMPAPRNSLLPASSRLKQPQLVAPRSALAIQNSMKQNVVGVAKSVKGDADEMNATVVVEKPAVVVPPPVAAPPVLSAIPRPSLISRIPGPRTTLK